MKNELYYNIADLYNGSSFPSLNHNTINTASSRSNGVMSHGSIACLAKTPCTDVMGTAKQ